MTPKTKSKICCQNEYSMTRHLDVKTGFNSPVLVVRLLLSEPLHKEVQSLAFIDVVSKLRAHENKTVSHQASLTEQRLTAQS